MMKRLLSTFLAAVLLCGFLPTAAAENSSAEQRLQAVTEKVKQTLALDTAAFTGFDGGLVENTLAPVWQLQWDSSAESLQVAAGEDGRVISFYRWDKQGQPAPDLRMPKVQYDAALKTAQAFADRVFAEDKRQTVTLARSDDSSILGRTAYHFTGNLQLNGVDSPLGVRMEVRAADQVVTRFERDDLISGYAPPLPAAAPQTDRDTAQQLLEESVSLRLEYVLNDDGKTAALRYLPNSRPAYYVDAHSGKLINLTELMKNMAVSAAPEAMADRDAGTSGLSEAEQSGIAKLAGVQTKEALDQKVRAMSALGLNGYTLSRASFYLDAATKTAAQPIVWAQLQYGKRESDSKIWNKTLTVNARTAKLQYLWTAMPYQEQVSRPVGEDAAKTKADAFLKQYFAAETAGYAPYVEDQSYAWGSNPDQLQTIYARQENGYFFAPDRYTVGISARDGSVVSFSAEQPQQAVAFESADGLIDAAKAREVWLAGFETPLSYIAVPVAVDLLGPDYQPLIERGERFISTLKLGYQHTNSPLARGVDAKTGKIVSQKASQSERISYTDLEGSWAKAIITRLADYGVGYRGKIFGAAQPLRQKDLLALLLSMWGTRYDPAELTGEQADALYEDAYRRGLLSRTERSDDKVLTRADAVRILLDGAGYGTAAKLEGIYQTRYTDAHKIPKAMYGYAALAQGLGLVQSKDTAFAGERNAIRAEAAVMVYQLLNR